MCGKSKHFIKCRVNDVLWQMFSPGNSTFALSPVGRRKTHHMSSAWTKKLCQDTSQRMPGKAKCSRTWFMSVLACYGGKEAARGTSGAQGGEAGTVSVESAVSHWLWTRFTTFRSCVVESHVRSAKGSSKASGTCACWVNLFSTSQTA